ncbi:MAG: AAA family ATPase [Methylocella sp.]
MNDAVHKFAPLTDAERVAVPAVAEEHDDGKHVSPIPADAPDVPKTHPRFGRPTATSVYRDEQGATLFRVLRFDPPGERKQFLTLSLWRDAVGLRWRWKAFPTPRPLYNLDKLAALPDAPVVVCEGEKSADAAARVFPNCVCITSPGGSQAASKANWSPLEGRRVLVWPDADEPGSRYAAEVAAILHPLDCQVSIIDASALPSIDPNDDPRGPAKGWDAADAVAEWQDLAALRQATGGLAKAFVPGEPGFFDANMEAQPFWTMSLLPASGIKPEPISWLWRDWLARGKMHIIAGQPGTGKTTLAMKMAGTVSAGSRWPDGTEATKGNVIRQKAML